MDVHRCPECGMKYDLDSGPHTCPEPVDPDNQNYNPVEGDQETGPVDPI